MAVGIQRVKGRRRRRSARGRQRQTATRSLLARIPSDELVAELKDQHHRALKALIENEAGDTREEQTLRWLIHFTEMDLSGLLDENWTALYDQLEHLMLRSPVSVRGFGPRFLNLRLDAHQRQQITEAQAAVRDCLQNLVHHRACGPFEGASVLGVATGTTKKLIDLGRRRNELALQSAHGAAEARGQAAGELEQVERQIGVESERARMRLIRHFTGALPDALVDLAGRSLEVAGIHRLRACLRPDCRGRLFLAAPRGDQKYCRPKTEAQEAAWEKHQQKRRRKGRPRTGHR
jgi:hypothetical protein